MNFKVEKPRDKGWKVKKDENKPGPGSEKFMEKAFKMTI